MAQNLKEIYQEIITAKEAETELSLLDNQASENMETFVSEISTSKVSIWRLWCFIVAFFSWSLQKSDDIFKIETEQITKEKQVTTLKWYQLQTLNFLFGKELKWDESVGKYVQKLDIGDDEEALKIVKHCAVTKAPLKLRVKIAGDNSGIPTQLTAAQATSVQTFLNQIEVPGTNIEVVNNTADKLKYEVDVYVDPLVINLANGELHNEPGVKPAELAINGYLFNLKFDGRFTNTFLIDNIQKAKGVTNAITLLLQHRYLGFPYADVPVSVVPDAGYFTFEFLTINYKPTEV